KINNTTYNLTLNLDNSWLEKAIYPVIIDPTIVNKEKNNIEDAYIYSFDDINYTYDNSILKVGLDKSEHSKFYQSLIKFQLPVIGTGSEVIGAKAYLYSHASDTTSNDNNNTIYVKENTKDWHENTVRYRDFENENGKIIDYFIPTRSKLQNNTVELQLNSFNLTNIVKEWYAGKPNYGVMLTTDLLPANCSEYTFCSKEYKLPNGEEPKPFLVITYRNLNGLEEYMSYITQSYTNGVSYINNLTGNLTTRFNLNETIGGKYPVSLSMIYNTNDVVLNKNLGYGLGLKLNLHETIEEVIIEAKKYLEYIDADGTIHYFTHNYDDNGNLDESKYIDEDGLGLTAILNNNEYIISDKDGNKYIFTKNNNLYYLTELVDTNNNTVLIEYLNNRIIKVTDANNKIINITYNSGNTTITSDYATTIVNYIGDKISSITNKNGTINFNYNGNLISKITDINGLSNEFTYYNNNPYKIKKVTEYGLNNEEGNSLSYEYGFLVTKVVDNKGRHNSYSFNERGNTIGLTNLDKEANLKNAYGKGMKYTNPINYKYTANESIAKINKAANSIATEILQVKYTKNLIKNSSFEKEVGLGRTSSYGRTNEASRSGSYSLDLTKGSINEYLEENKWYTFSGYYKNEEPIEIFAQSQAYANGPCYLYMGVIPRNEEFTRYNFSFFLPENKTQFMVDFTTKPNSKAYLDDIQLEEGRISNYYNFIENGDFSSGLEGWNINNNNGSVISENGVKVLKINFIENKYTGFSKTIDIKGKKDDIYCLSFWYKNSGLIPSIPNNELTKKPFLNFNYSNNVEVNDEDYFNYYNDNWIYFSKTYKAQADFNNITLNFEFLKSIGSINITNIMLSNGLDFENNYYDEDNGNLKQIEGSNSNIKEFKYDKNNQLTSMFNPKGNNFKFEYDNEIPNRIIKGLSPTGISNEIKYDTFGNPIKTLINNVNPNNEIISGNNYYLRLKGSNKYWDCNFNIGQINIKENDCSHDAFTVTKLGDNYYFQIANLFIDGDASCVRLLNETSGTELFELHKQDNGSYKIMSYLYKQYLCNNNDTLALSDDNTKEEDMQFYFEDINTPLFIESKAEYTEDGKFLTKTIDALGKETIY
ncbi:MAG: hypothetical protein HFI36_07590, partial [Bacilli bacterium]|nr:hypothetical protein [Bacilli bacterium]